ncbi:hypothetical protein HYDPIDRAFT_41021 [Hydnomerulius pinastri MD-312]|uniref:Uncharacterized protein n=1 Tax=Hydnomerulius pinastri MD-312 TaxID=994086 RepID=A0A0C9WE53_9AGAM|nr:hypothetical protein HYDPIDRAFT_41021 [Hydnomerulius pinastri MD-312]
MSLGSEMYLTERAPMRISIPTSDPQSSSHHASSSKSSKSLQLRVHVYTPPTAHNRTHTFPHPSPRRTPNSASIACVSSTCQDRSRPPILNCDRKIRPLPQPPATSTVPVNDAAPKITVVGLTPRTTSPPESPSPRPLPTPPYSVHPRRCPLHQAASKTLRSPASAPSLFLPNPWVDTNTSPTNTPLMATVPEVPKSAQPTSSNFLSPLVIPTNRASVSSASSAQTLITPISPQQPSPFTVKRRRFSKLRRHFGDSPPAELVFGITDLRIERDPMRDGEIVESPVCDDDDDDSKGVVEEVEGGAESDSESDCVDYTVVQNRQPNFQYLSKQLSKKWLREKGGGRYSQLDYEDVISCLRAL